MAALGQDVRIVTTGFFQGIIGQTGQAVVGTVFISKPVNLVNFPRSGYKRERDVAWQECAEHTDFPVHKERLE